MTEQETKCWDFPFLYCKPGYLVECEGCPKNKSNSKWYIKVLEFIGLIIGCFLFVIALLIEMMVDFFKGNKNG
jgi:hypothetical protein